MKNHIRFPLIFLAGFFLQSCGEPDPTPTTSSKPLTEADKKSAEAVALKFEEGIRNGDRVFLKTVFDFQRIFDRAIEGIDVPADFARGFKQGMANGTENAIDNLLSGKFDLVEMREVDHVPVGLFRVSIDDGLEYVEYHFERVEGTTDDWVIFDGYTYSMGTYISDLLRSMLGDMLKDNPSALAKAFGAKNDSELLLHMPKIQQIIQTAKMGDGEGALEIRDRLPASLKTHKLVMIGHILAAGKLPGFEKEGSEYMKALEAYQKSFPEDASFALLSIDLHIGKGDFEGAREAIDSLKAQTNDPYLDFYKGYVALHEEDYAVAEKLARDWMAAAPDDQEGWDLLLEAGFGKNDHAVTVEALTMLESKFDMDYSAILTEPDFTDFANSPEGKAWAAARN